MDCDPADVVAVVYDGADRGVDEAPQYTQLLALAPAMQVLLAEAVGAWSEQFDSLEDQDLSVVLLSNGQTESSGPNRAEDRTLYRAMAGPPQGSGATRRPG